LTLVKFEYNNSKNWISGNKKKAVLPTTEIDFLTIMTWIVILKL